MLKGGNSPCVQCGLQATEYEDDGMIIAICEGGCGHTEVLRVFMLTPEEKALDDADYPEELSEEELYEEDWHD